MTGTTLTGKNLAGENLDNRRRRIIFRAWHRGIREMDLVIGQYVDAHIADLNDSELDELEFIMSFEDRDLLTWVTGEIAIPAEVDKPIFRAMLDYRSKIDFVS